MLHINDYPAHTAPFPFWFWNGKLDCDELVRQVRLMREVGIDEFIIHARYGLQTPFLSEEWFVAVGAVISEAAATGMRAWLYDDLNWPSGTAGRAITQDRDRREHFISDDGQLCQAGQYSESSPDYLNLTITKKFIELCYQPYCDRFGEHFGKTIPGFFNDEVRFLTARPWSPAMGSSVPTGGDYFLAIGNGIIERYFEPIADWCADHGVELIGHVMGEETLGSQVRYLSDGFGAVSCFHQPGIDHLGTAAEGPHPRLASSAAFVRGTRNVTCETFGGNPWNFTPSDLYRISGWLYASGVTRIILHGFFYARDGEAATDWPPDIFFRWEHWGEIQPYIKWAARVQNFLRQAQPIRPVALYYPLEEFWADYRPDINYTLMFQHGPKVAGDTALKLHIALGELQAALEAENIDYDLIPSKHLDKVADRIVICPADTKPQFTGRKVSQERRTAKDCVAEVSRILGKRPMVTGPNSRPAPLDISERLSDPYLHSERDAGGVLVRQFILDGKPAVMLWNANADRFAGRCDLAEMRRWNYYTPSDGQCRDLGEIEKFEFALGSHTMAILLAK